MRTRCWMRDWCHTKQLGLSYALIWWLVPSDRQLPPLYLLALHAAECLKANIRIFSSGAGHHKAARGHKATWEQGEGGRVPPTGCSTRKGGIRKPVCRVMHTSWSNRYGTLYDEWHEYTMLLHQRWIRLDMLLTCRSVRWCVTRRRRC